MAVDNHAPASYNLREFQSKIRISANTEETGTYHGTKRQNLFAWLQFCKQFFFSIFEHFLLNSDLLAGSYALIGRQNIITLNTGIFPK